MKNTPPRKNKAKARPPGRPVSSPKGKGKDRVFYLRDDQHKKIRDKAKAAGIKMSQLVGRWADGL